MLPHTMNMPDVLVEQRGSDIATSPLDFRRESRMLFDDCAPAYPEMDPYWGSFDELRRELDLDDLLPELAVAGGILDAGCGPALHLRDMIAWCTTQVPGSRLQVTGLDFSERMLARAVRALRETVVSVRTHFVLGDLVQPDWRPPHPFDCVLCLNNTLGNIVGCDLHSLSADRLHVLAYLRQLLRPGGFFLLSVFDRANLPRTDGTVSAYSRDRRIDAHLSDVARGDLVLWRNCADGVEHCCVSHWFTNKEVQHLLTSVGFTDLNLCTVGPRILCSAKCQ
jgi:SAM-dependent methyltransferase